MINKLVNKYFLIDKSLLKYDNSYPFDIFIAKGDKVELSLLKNKKYLKIKSFDIESKLYVHSSEKLIYDDYLKTISFIEEKKLVFKNATESIDKIFSNPELLSSQQQIKPIVNSLIEVIFQDDFTMSIVFELLNYDYYTHTHSLNVTVLTLALGKKLNLEKKDLEDLGLSALLHDIGKSKIDKRILNKKSALSPREFEIMKKHALYGYSYALKIGIDKKSILAGIKSHHEKIDGTGYPDGLKGDEIHLFSKIIGICDIFDALISKRAYKNPLSIYETLLLIKTQMKNKLDMNLFNHFILLLKDNN